MLTSSAKAQLRYRYDIGFTKIVRLHGARILASECAMYMGIDDQTAELALVSKYGTAYVLLTDGRIANGIFGHFPYNHTCAIS